MLALSSVSLASPASARALLPSPDTLRSSEPCIPTCLREYESCVAAVAPLTLQAALGMAPSSARTQQLGEYL